MRLGGIPTTLKLTALVALTIAAVLWPRPGPAHAAGVVAVAAGGEHTCALTTAGGVKCWGQNLAGQVGDGTTAARRLTPVDVLEAPGGPPFSGVVAIAAGGSYTCALTTAGGVKCWGNNFFGQLGDGTTAIRTTPVDVVGLESGVAAVAAGGLHACALTTAGAVKCWGRNESGQLGDGTRGDGDPETLDNNRTTPVDVCQDYDDVAQQCTQLLSGVTAIAAGSNHTCAVMAAGGAKCWGLNLGGQLGDGTGSGDFLDPVVLPTPVDVCQDYDDVAEQCVETLPGVAAVSAGLFHTCAVITAGGLKCWGASFHGKLGDGKVCGADFPFVCPTPVDVCQVFDDVAQQCMELLTGVAAVDLGSYHGCVLTVGSGVQCWGWNTFGQLGDGTTRQRTTPVQVIQLATAVAAGGFHTCALMVAGGVKCWGENFWGQLGSGFCCNDRRAPVDVSGLGPKPTPSATPTRTPSPTPTSTLTLTPSPTPIATLTPPSATPTPSATVSAATLAAATPMSVVAAAVALPATGAGGGAHGEKLTLWPIAALAGAGATACASCFVVTRRGRQRKEGRT